MKKSRSHFFAFCVFTSSIAFSQTPPPPGINYQAVARDGAGNPLVSTAVSVDFIIHRNSAGGPTVYSENQNTTTNLFGLFNLVIGSVDPATFSGIQWNTDSFFLEVQVNGNFMGTTQFLSVPYSYHSKTADSITSPTLRAWKKVGTNIFPNTITDNVGIGTSNPLGQLHVFSPAAANFDIEAGGGSLGLTPQINFRSKEDGLALTQRAMISAGSSGLADQSGYLSFLTRPSSGGIAERMRITSDGKTGINTTAPGYYLHVLNPTVNPTNMMLEAGSGCAFDLSYKLKTSCNEWLLGKETGGGDASNLFKIKHVTSGFVGFAMLPFQVGIGTNQPLQLFHIKDWEIPANTIDDDGDGATDETNGVFVFTREGTIGIGTAVPTAALDVRGNVKIVDGTQGAGKVLTSDAAGLASWMPPPTPLSTFTVYPSPGTFTFTVPAGVFKIKAEAWGAGGGGGGSTISAGGGGGGGGAYTMRIYTVSPGQNITIVVGNAGGGGAPGNTGGASGGSSTINDGTTTITASGGSGAGANGISGSGGSPSGAAGVISSGGGGAEAGSTTTSGAGGMASIGGGGGKGIFNQEQTGNPGLAPGGGGSGGGSTSANQAGGAGANGRAVIWW